MENQTFLGDIYGVPIFADTKDEAKIQKIGKYLKDADNSYLGLLDKDPYFIYCNEAEWLRDSGKILFKCGPGCRHNPIK